MSTQTERQARFEWFRATCERLHDELSPVRDGAVASYIPELTQVDPDLFAIAGVTLDGRRIAVGDHDHTFTIQSISKLPMYGLALGDHGRAAVLDRVGVAPTGESFNAIALDHDGRRHRAPNPMVNAGAIAVTDMVAGGDREARLDHVMSMYESYLGRRPTIDEDVWRSEHDTGHRNRALAYLMLSHGIVGPDVEETLDLYFAQCSTLVTVDDLAVIGATLANAGAHPDDGRVVVDPLLTRDMLTVTLTCGMYDYSGEWAFSVGIPAKSGVGGGILGILPGAGAVAVFSPRLDEHGNSVRGIRVFEELSREFGMHLFDPDRPWTRSD